MKTPKYRAKKCSVEHNGQILIFDSKAEMMRWRYLVAMPNITELELQPEYELQAKFKRNNRVFRAEKYIADFRYRLDRKTVVEDVKGFKTDVYKSKMKRFLFMNPDVIFKEIMLKNGRWCEVVY